MMEGLSTLTNQIEKTEFLSFSLDRNGLRSWWISRLLLNFLSISPQMLAQAEERLYESIGSLIKSILFTNNISRFNQKILR